MRHSSVIMGTFAAACSRRRSVSRMELPGGHAFAQQQPRALPTFAVDPSWPKVPDKYKLGDISSIAIDAQDNAYVLHRPAR